MTAAILSNLCLIFSLTIVIGLYINPLEKYEENCIWLIEYMPKSVADEVKLRKCLMELYLYLLMMLDIMFIINVLRALYK